MVSTFILLMDLMMAVGPCLSAPCVGLIPSDNGFSMLNGRLVLLRLIHPVGVLLEIDNVP